MNKKTKIIILIAAVILLLILVGLCIYLGTTDGQTQPTEPTAALPEEITESANEEIIVPADNVAVRTEPQEEATESVEVSEETVAPTSAPKAPNIDREEHRPVETNPPSNKPAVTDPPATEPVVTDPPVTEPVVTDPPSTNLGDNQTPPAIRG